jgi:hypothetical protein
MFWKLNASLGDKTRIQHNQIATNRTTINVCQLNVGFPPGTWMFVYFKCCVLSGRGIFVGPIPRPEESYRVWWDCVCDLENLNNEAAYARIVLLGHRKIIIIIGRSGDGIPVWTRFFAPVQTSPGAHRTSCTVGTGSHSRGKSDRTVELKPTLI